MPNLTPERIAQMKVCAEHLRPRMPNIEVSTDEFLALLSAAEENAKLRHIIAVGLNCRAVGDFDAWCEDVNDLLFPARAQGGE